MGITGKRKRQAILILIVGSILLLAFGTYRWSRRDKGSETNTTSTFTVQRGDLVMSVTESGTIKARNAVEIKSQVEGSATIVSLAPEGSYVSQEDVANGKILVELDSSKLRDDLNEREMAYNSAEADYTEAKESLTIQKNQNDSNIQQGLMKVKFGKMDLQKYLGEETANALLDEYKTTGKIPAVTELINDPNRLGGESLQNYRELSSAIDLDEEEFKRAQTKLGWTEKLFEKSYVSRSDLETDQLSVARLQVKREQAETALTLFIQYDFPKQAEKYFSDYLETEREMERIYAKARSELAQREASLSSSEAKYLLNKERLERIKKQIEACTVKATAPGMVIYASSERGRFGGSRTYIEVGQDVRERELIMTVTDSEEMDVDVKVHETNVDKVRLGQPVKIVIDAQPDKVFTGKVQKIAPLPDPQSIFGNPDLKVYTTLVSLEGASSSMKPGMSARVEILIAELQDVLSVPVQCVANRSGRKVCYVMDRGGAREQVIQTGAFNDRFIQVLDGLTQGQQVLLNPPRLLTADEKGEKAPTDQTTQAVAASAAEGQPAQGATLQAQPEPEQPQRPDAAAAPAASAQGKAEDRFKEMDKDGDGKISLAGEVPEQARQFLQPLDTDKDGFIDAKEIEAAKNTFGGGRGGGRRARSSRTDDQQEQGPPQ